MSELRWALLLTAAVVLVALYMYGKWQERRSRGQESNPDADVDATAAAAARTSTRHSRQAPPRIEPTMGIPASGETLSDAARDSDEQVGDDPPGTMASVGGWVEDPLLDLMLELRCVHAFDGVAALEARAQLDRLALPLPTHLAVWDSKAARWSLPDRFGFYSEMLIAVQLATRRDALGEIDATRFVAAVQQIAVSIDADFDAPEIVRIVRQAAELDRLCARFDVQITLTLEAQAGAWNLAVIDGAATEARMVRVEPGHWQLIDALNAPLLSMTAVSTAPSLYHSLAITLDVPRVASEPPPLSVLFTTASQMAARLNARVVDDNGRAVETVAQSAIEAELEKLMAEMRAAGIEPGSARARRLYAQ